MNGGRAPRISYDEPSDSLYITFAPGRIATGIELNENLLLRMDKSAGEPVGLTIFNYSILSGDAETGLLSLPLAGLGDLHDELRDLVLRVLRQPALTEFLTLSPDDRNLPVPIASLHLGRMLQHA